MIAGLDGGRLLEAKAADTGPRVTWKPLPGSQTLAMSYGGHIILYHGTRGPGKTDAQLMRFRRRVGLGYGRHWRGIIFDREYKNLDDLVAKSMRWFPNIGAASDKPRFLSSKSDYRWVWPTGEELLFRAIKRDTDYWSYHGQEFPFIGWNELTKYPTDDLYEALMSCNRSSFRPEDYPIWVDGDLYKTDNVIVPVEQNAPNAAQYVLPELPLEIFATCNPHGPGHNWVKKKFINAAPMGNVVRKSINVFNPRTQRREDVVKTQVHLFGSYRENIYLSPEYIAELETMSDKNKRKAWLGGSWDIVAGGMFDDVWDSDYNVVPRFKIPATWRLDRSFDWGSSKPFSVGWWAESDGSDIQMPDGRWCSTVRGDCFRFMEWYGSTGKPNQGLQLLANKIAEGIIERELLAGVHGRVMPGPADGSIYDVENGNCIAADMARDVRISLNGGPLKTYRGVTWVRADKSPGSRKHGWERLRSLLKNAHPVTIRNAEGNIIRLPRERAGLFAMSNCTHFQDLFPNLPRDEKDTDDVDTEAEDHIGDETRYKALDMILGSRGGTTKGT